MTFLFEITVPLLALIGTGFVSAGLVMLLMTLGMPDEKEREYNLLHEHREKQRLLQRLIDEN